MPTPQLPENLSSPPVREMPDRGDGSRSPREIAQRLELQRLAKEVRSLEKNGGTGSRTSSRPVSSTGCPGMDALLPTGGYEAGTIVEYLRSTPACGASHLAFAAAAAAMRERGGYLVVVDGSRQIYPPALNCHGIDLQRVIFVHPETSADLLWTVDQGLRTPAVAAVVAECPFVDDRAARRLQLAAENGSSLGVLIRSVAARRNPTWAEVQWVVRGSRSSQLSSNQLSRGQTFSGQAFSGHASGKRDVYVQLARVRGGRAGPLLRVEISATTGAMQARQLDGRERNRHEQREPHDRHATRAMHLASQLADPAGASRRA